MRHKVLAYVLRPCATGTELLVFAHRDHPDAGVQVPAGTVEPGEDVEAAAVRELMAKVTKADEPAADQIQRRHVFAFEPASPLPDRWNHSVRGAGEDAGLVFEFYWAPISPGLTLAGGQERFLHQLALIPPDPE
jgi:8-oxo-dGTP diphosphatase